MPVLFSTLNPQADFLRPQQVDRARPRPGVAVTDLAHRARRNVQPSRHFSLRPARGLDQAYKFFSSRVQNNILTKRLTSLVTYC